MPYLRQVPPCRPVVPFLRRRQALIQPIYPAPSRSLPIHLTRRQLATPMILEMQRTVISGISMRTE